MIDSEENENNMVRRHFPVPDLSIQLDRKEYLFIPYAKHVIKSIWMNKFFSSDRKNRTVPA